MEDLRFTPTPEPNIRESMRKEEIATIPVRDHTGKIVEFTTATEAGKRLRKVLKNIKKEAQ